MAKIVCDNPEIEKNLQRQISLVSEAGGFIHPALELIVETTGQIRVESTLSKTDKRAIVYVPTECLPSVDDFEVTVEKGRIVAAPASEAVLDRHVEAMQLMLELYNLTNKIGFHRETFPVFSLRSVPEIYHHLMTHKKPDPKKPLESIDLMATVSDEAVMASFFATRWASLSAGDISRTSVLMPIIDLFNHDCGSPGFLSIRSRQTAHGAAGFGMSVGHSQPRDTNECFVCYQFHDALKTYLYYGFLDTSALFVRCVPMVINLPAIGVINVTGASPVEAVPFKHPAIDDLKQYMPHVAQVGSNALDISHLIVPPPVAAVTLRRVLEFLIRSIAPVSTSPEGIANNVAKAERQVLSGTEDFYRQLAELLKSSSASKLPQHVFDALQGLSRHQLSQLERYKQQVESKALTYIGKRRVYASR